MGIERFIEAHNAMYNQALEEIKNGRKETHWIWYIFPQIEGLGMSLMAQKYAIKDINEAREYINNEMLYKHLIEITSALLEIDTDDIYDIMQYPDDMKLKSCMTLFSVVDSSTDIYTKVLNKYYSGIQDEETIKILKRVNK